MSTLISYSNSSGEHRRCDAKCYDAEGEHCECVCGGTNHGAGKDQAARNASDWVKALKIWGFVWDNGMYKHPDGSVIRYDRQLAMF